MEKVKLFFRNLSFRKSFMLYVCVALFAAYLASGFTSSYCRTTILLLNANKYSYVDEESRLTTEDGRIFYSSEVPDYSPEDKQKIDFLNMLGFWCVPVYVGIAVAIAAALLYHKKMKKPLAILEEASGKIAENDLDFSIAYEGKDEMGRLCGSFEKMRGALLANNRLMWQQMEQRKRLNAAFAHDLRTPLTVLKGHLEMMQQGDEPKQVGAIVTMTKQINRLERYVDSMSNMQKLEDMQPKFCSVVIDELMQAIQQMAAFVCGKAGKSIAVQTHIVNPILCMDESIVYQVTENLVSNAARYAKSCVHVSVTEKNDVLEMIVHDDGHGFSPESLEHAAEPYYTESQKRGKHFGLGLYIGKILTQHHGGALQLKSDDSGAAVIASFCIKFNE